MIGKFQLKRISKKTGECEIILKEYNQVAAGFPTAMINVLTGTGSRNVEDYSFRYFQLGNNKYDLSTFDISGDIPSESLKKNVWTMKSPLTLSSYGSNSVLPVIEKNIYGLGSIIPYSNTKVFDNFIDPPDNTKVLDDYTNNFQTFYDGQRAEQGKKDSATMSSIWVAGCSPSWEDDRYGVKHTLWVSAADLAISGPTCSHTASTWDPVYVAQYNGSEDVENITGCLRIANDYKYDNGLVRSVWNDIRTNQTASVYYAPEYYTSANISLSGSTPITGGLQIFNQTASAGTEHKEAGENKVSFKYKFDLTTNSTATDAAWYPPDIIEVSSGYDNCFNTPGDCSSNWRTMYGSLTQGGVVSANVYCTYGALYTWADALNGYNSRSGPGAQCYDTPNCGFGPSGNFYRVSISLMDVPNEIISFDNGTLSGAASQIRQYPMLSALSVMTGDDLSSTVGDRNAHNVSPRERVYLSNFQFEYNSSATPNQYIHAERPYYINTPQYFIQIPHAYTTSLHDDSINIRLLIDEYLANGQTIKEVGLFLKNPGGVPGIDNPYLSGYKILDTPLKKNNEFSYIIDWELSVTDSDSI